MLSTFHKDDSKIGALELAHIFSEAVDVLKNPTPIYKQLKELHAEVQSKISEHGKILTDNQKILDEHKAARVAWSLEQEQEKSAREKHLKEMHEREQSLLVRDNALGARDTSLNKREKAVKSREEDVSARENNLISKEANLREREKAAALLKEQAEKLMDQARAKHDKLKEVIG